MKKKLNHQIKQTFFKIFSPPVLGVMARIPELKRGQVN